MSGESSDRQNNSPWPPCGLKKIGSTCMHMYVRKYGD